MKYFLCLFINLAGITAIGQPSYKAIVADSLSHKPLPFATVRAERQNTQLAGVDGSFRILMRETGIRLKISYVGYVSRDLFIEARPGSPDTIFLMPAPSNLNEITVIPDNEKIRRIINETIRNKALHDPDKYDRYQCYIYYKFKADLILNKLMDTVGSSTASNSQIPDMKKGIQKMSRGDTGRLRNFMMANHLVLAETYSRRNYRRPHQTQDDIIASRFSGLKKTYFTSLVTDVMPFHVYRDYISLNGTDYINPIARGWQDRYRFRLEDELYSGEDTIYILSFRPKKNAAFHSLRGIVYINSDGYAISNFISSTGDSADDREIRIEQKYTRTGGRWFPEELNYDVLLKKYPSPMAGMHLNGHSIINLVRFDSVRVDFKRAHPVALSDSVDLYTEEQWQKFRPDGLTQKESNTYRSMDSLSLKVGMENKVNAFGKLALGKFGIGPLDLDITRLANYNEYEGTRIGAGLSTNDRVSRYFSLGAWAGYGIGDHRWKYGASATLYPFAEKDDWLGISYQNNYRSEGDVQINPEIDKETFRNWILTSVDQISQYNLTFHTQRGYWQIEAEGSSGQLQSLYQNGFQIAGKNIEFFQFKEAGLNFRYAYGEKRIPLFGYYEPFGTSYPTIYLRLTGGDVNSGSYSTDYYKVLAALAYAKHTGNWGYDHFQLEGGLLQTLHGQPLPPSFLLAGKGFRNDYFNYYAWGGFITMRPYDYFSDRYISLFYCHDFDHYLWNWKFSKPFISIAHNLIYGSLSQVSSQASPTAKAPVNGFYETGILLNQLVSINYLHLANINLNAGVFYHWSRALVWNQNLIWAAGSTISF